MTIAEAVVAFGLMSVLSLSVIGVFSKLLTASAKSSDQTAGRLLAKGVLDRALREGPPNWGVGGNFSSFGGEAALYAHDSLSGTSFVYQVLPNEVVTTTNSMGRLYEVTVTVTWWRDRADAGATREGVGRLSTELTRTVYFRN